MKLFTFSPIVRLKGYFPRCSLSPFGFAHHHLEGIKSTALIIQSPSLKSTLPPKKQAPPPRACSRHPPFIYDSSIFIIPSPRYPSPAYLSRLRVRRLIAASLSQPVLVGQVSTRRQRWGSRHWR